jgi:hypothetical protein
LWRGGSLFFLNGAFVAASIGALLMHRVRPETALVAFDLFLVVLVLLVRGVWLALHVESVHVEQILEGCFTRTRATYSRVGNAYVLTVAESELLVTLRAPFRGVISIGFAGNLRSKKGQLIRALIGKQFRGSFPAIKVRA